MAVIEQDTPGRIPTAPGTGGSLLHWVNSRAGVNGWWAQDRDRDHKNRWEEYYRLWRGIWSASDKTRMSERSRLIAPALQQAIEGITSEIESAVLDKKSFFDVVDDPNDVAAAMASTETQARTPEEAAQQNARRAAQQDMVDLRTRLYYAMTEADYDLSMAEVFLNGSIWGTGIGKINFEDIEFFEVENQDGEPVPVPRVKPQARLIPIIPQQFTIDTAAKRLADAIGYAHTYPAPRHEILELQRQGIFRDVPLARQTPKDPIDSDENTDSNADSVNIVDYRGKVPRSMLEEFQLEADAFTVGGDVPPEGIELGEDEFFVDLDKPGAQELGRDPGIAGTDVDASISLGHDEDDLVEAFVVIVNEQHILKAEENPLFHKDRLVVAYRHEIVPDQFWGRGAAEKGYNSQKALDASMRARIDGLALTVHPMMAMDAGRMPRGFKFTVSPGRNILTNGDPKEILNPLNFGQIDPNIFTDNAELERMVMMATGGMDTAAPVKVNGRNETAAGQSMQLGNFVKRSKRTIRNIEKEFVVPMVQQTARLYMQFDSENFPVNDYTFRAISVLGTMARELEQMHFASMINTVPETSPAFWMLMKSFYQSSSLSNREEMVPMIDAQMQQVLNPPQPQPTMLERLQMLQLTESIKNERIRQITGMTRARAEIARAETEARQVPSEVAVNETNALLNLAKAEGEEAGTQMNIYKAQLDALEREAAIKQQEIENVLTTRETGTTANLDRISGASRLEDILAGS
ncbi:MAG: hypothetical protein GY906_38425 [bacterium]|nr:hypothetical protein [bacterium]